MYFPTRRSTPALLLCLTGLTLPAYAAESDVDKPIVDEVVIWGQQNRSNAGAAHPSSLLQADDFASINGATTEDLVKYAPSLVIRRRFIGDANGTLGMRGANMFQTSRSMVFADGVPLHYLLQGRWNGAPRWTLVSASEIAQVEVLYGPFSAEYSGNAMGGVVLIESAIPQQREFHFDSTLFSQDFSAYGFSDQLAGYKSFLSAGDRFGDTSVLVSWNRLENRSQPQTFYFGGSAGAAVPTTVSGAIAGNDERSVPRLWFGDTGSIDNLTDNFKLKLGQDFGAWQILLNVAYEDRLAEANTPNSYLRTANGSTVWSGVVVQNGVRFDVPAARLGINTMERNSLSTGLRVRGPLHAGVEFEANLNRFDVLRDETRNSLANPADVRHTLRGEVLNYGTTGWTAAEAKLRFDALPLANLALVTGVRHEDYELNLDIYSSNDYPSSAFAAFTNRSGGRSALDAMFVQADWAFATEWELGLGLRAERFRSKDGYFSRDLPATPGFDLVAVPGTNTNELSPKLSLAWQGGDNWRLAYIFGEAWRFPIVEELFSQYAAYNAVSVANPQLQPEHGLHHNLMLDYRLDGGLLRLNLFQEAVRDVIEAQSEQLPGGLTVRTFVPVDEVATRGAEFIANLDSLWFEPLDVRLNLVWTDSHVVRNQPDPSLAGKLWPRMPKWRGNMLATWHFTPAWDLGFSLQYAADSFGRNDNLDRENNVFGAQDGYIFAGLKTTWRLDSGVALGLGIDNLTDYLAFVAHPWPGRTWYANLAYDF